MMKLSTLALAILAVLGFSLVPNVAGISVTMSTDDVSITDEYSLADETDLLADVTLMDGVAIQSTMATGSKQNAMSTQASSAGFGAQAAVSIDGEFSASTMTVASKEGAVLSSNVAGTGSAIAEVHGVSGADAAGQQAAVFNGAMDSAQMVAVGGGAVAGQGTSMRGEAGSMISQSSSADNQMVAIGGFAGEAGTMNAQTMSGSSGFAAGTGNVAINGVESLNAEIAQDLAESGMSMQMDGLSMSQTGTVGQFGFSVTNTNKAPAASSVQALTAGSASIISSGTNPEIVQNPAGNANAYVLLGRKIDQSKPIQLYLKTDSYLTAEKLSADASNQAITSAANTWDYWTKPTQNNLFQASVISDSSKKADAADGYSVNAFLPFSGGAIAYARSYVDGRGYVREADIVYNSNYAWTTDYSVARVNTKAMDLQTVALHELGHLTGLGDLYVLPSTDPRKADLKEIMNAYVGPRHNLGPGDIKGLRSIYGV